MTIKEIPALGELLDSIALGMPAAVCKDVDAISFTRTGSLSEMAGT
jgi:hypothetical protein